MEFFDMFNPTSHFRVFVDNKKLDGFIRPFYQTENFCRNDCENCNYCESFAKKCIDPKELEEVYNAAKEFFHQYDPFNRLIDSTNRGTTHKNKEKRVDINMRNVDFELK